MRSFTVLLQGNINSDLTYNISLLDDFTQGHWELGVSSLGFSYTSQNNPAVLKLTCNCVLGKYVNTTNQVYTSEEVLQLVIYGGKSVGTKVVIGIKNRDFFRLNNMEQILRVALKDAETDQYVSGAQVHVLMMFRRVA